MRGHFLALIAVFAACSRLPGPDSAPAAVPAPNPADDPASDQPTDASASDAPTNPKPPPPPPPPDCSTLKAAAGAAPLKRMPYLSQVTDSSAVIAWVLASDQPTEARFGKGGNLGSSASGTGVLLAKTITGFSNDEMQYAASLMNLDANQSYCYQIFASGVAVTDGFAFHTAPVRGGETPFTALVLGDSGSGDTAQSQIRDQMKKAAFDLILHTGDIAYEAGTYLQFSSRVFGVYQDFFERAPFFPSPGNHEYGTSSAAPYLKLFYLPENAGRAKDKERYYSFDWGNVHFAALDSMTPMDQIGAGGSGLDMGQWLAADLDASTQPWKIVYFHYPGYSSGPHGAESSASDVRKKLVPIFEAHGVDLVLNGHDHDYERTKPLRGGVAASDGITYVVSGGGGAGLYAKVSTNAFTEVYSETHHFLQLNVAGCRIDGRALDGSGRSIDAFTLSKCP